jgi:AcrR family transcriptional regulator
MRSRQLSTAPIGGRRRLLDAAIRLGARARGTTALGLRELAREAGLNPNTFYRHFESLDDLGLAVIAEVAEPLRASLRDSRRRAAARATGGPVARARAVNQESVAHFFAVVEQHPQAFMVAVRELHGASPVLRRALQRHLEQFTADMAEDIHALALLPAVDEAAVAELSSFVIQQLFFWSLDYLEHPTRRAELRGRAERLIEVVFLGATARQEQGA